MKRKRWIIVGILVLVELLVCGAILLALWGGRAAFERARLFYWADTHVKETLEETFVVDGPAVLDVEAMFGDVTVTGGEDNEVHVIARLEMWGADEEDARRQVDVEMTQEGNRITIRVTRPTFIYFFGFTRGPRVDFEIRVPAETSVWLKSSSGDLKVRNVTGTVELQTVSGDIEVEEVNGALSARSTSGNITLLGLSDAGDLEVRTVSGDVELQDITADSLTIHTTSGHVQVEGGTLSGGLNLETVSGDATVVGVRATSYRLASFSGNLTLDGGSGLLEVRTTSGEIEVENATEAILALSTTSGEIHFSGSLHAEEEHRVESTSGDVCLVLPADAAFDLDAETVSGAIQTDFAVTMTEFDERKIVGEVNGGGPLVRINTISGNITLQSTSGR